MRQHYVERIRAITMARTILPKATAVQARPEVRASVLIVRLLLAHSEESAAGLAPGAENSFHNSRGSVDRSVGLRQPVPTSAPVALGAVAAGAAHPSKLLPFGRPDNCRCREAHPKAVTRKEHAGDDDGTGGTVGKDLRLSPPFSTATGTAPFPCRLAPTLDGQVFSQDLAS